jgi:hypothetical protein
MNDEAIVLTGLRVDAFAKSTTLVYDVGAHSRL